MFAATKTWTSPSASTSAGPSTNPASAWGTHAADRRLDSAGPAGSEKMLIVRCPP